MTMKFYLSPDRKRVCVLQCQKDNNMIKLERGTGLQKTCKPLSIINQLVVLHLQFYRTAGGETNFHFQPYYKMILYSRWKQIDERE